MFEIRDYKGWWWLPGKEDERLPGTLRIERGVADLDLTDHFGYEILYETEKTKVGSGLLAPQPRILGLSSNGDLLTTERHISANCESHSAGVSISTYRRAVTLIGKHFEKNEKIGFDEIAIRASDLTAWTQVKAIETKGRFRKQRGARYYVWSGASARWKKFGDTEIRLARGDRASIRFGGQFEGIDIHGRGSEHASLTQTTELRFHFAKRASLEQVFERVGQVRNFLRLAIGRPVAILSVTGYQHDYKEERTNRVLPVELVWVIPHNPDPPETPLHPYEMLFTLPEASPDISKVMRSWFAKQARLKPVFNLFFGTRYHPDLYLDVRFLLYAQAVETYGYRRHRTAVDGNFADKINDVLSICPTVSRKIVGDAGTFVPHLKITRDFYTHYNPKKEKPAAKGTALLLLVTQLHALLEMALLRELGFTIRAIDAILERVDRYREIEHFEERVAEEESQAARMRGS